MSYIFQEFFMYYFFLFFLHIKQSNACSLLIQDPRIAFEDIDASELYPCVMFYSGTPGEKVGKFDIKSFIGNLNYLYPYQVIFNFRSISLLRVSNMTQILDIELSILVFYMYKYFFYPGCAIFNTSLVLYW